MDEEENLPPPKSTIEDNGPISSMEKTQAVDNIVTKTSKLRSECLNNKINCTKRPLVIADQSSDKDGSRFGMRHVQALLLFFCFFVAFFLRINLSIAIVAMTDRNSTQSGFVIYPWNEQEKGAILSSFFWGYLVMQPLAGQLGQLYKSKPLLGMSLLACSFLSIIVPFVVSLGGWIAFCCLRVLLGLSQGFLLPISYTLASKWSPPDEKNRFVGFSLNGATLGACITFPISGFLAASRFGWPSIFYVSGLLGIVWTCFWYIYGADSPSTHTRISEEERNFIIRSLGNEVSDNKRLKTPWKAIFTSLPFWALVGAHLGNGWYFGILITQLPSFISSALGFDLTSNGLLSALPFFSMWILTFPMCWLGDFLISKGILSKTTSRKLWTFVSLTGGPLVLILMTCVGDNLVVIVTLMVIAVTLTLFIFFGYNINHLDLSPNFAGLTMGICNAFEMITSTVAPLSVGFIVYEPFLYISTVDIIPLLTLNANKSQIEPNKKYFFIILAVLPFSSIMLWRREFFLTAFLGISASLVFFFFGSGEQQPWNNPSNPANNVPLTSKPSASKEKL